MLLLTENGSSGIPLVRPALAACRSWTRIRADVFFVSMLRDDDADESVLRFFESAQTETREKERERRTEGWTA